MEFEYYPSAQWRKVLPTEDVDYGNARSKLVYDPEDLELLYHMDKQEFYRQLKYAVKTNNRAQVTGMVRMVRARGDEVPYDAIMRWAWDYNQPEMFIHGLHRYLFKTDEDSDLSGINIHYTSWPLWTFGQLSVLRALPHSDTMILIRRGFAKDVLREIKSAISRYILRAGSERFYTDTYSSLMA